MIGIEVACVLQSAVKHVQVIVGDLAPALLHIVQSFNSHASYTEKTIRYCAFIKPYVRELELKTLFAGMLFVYHVQKTHNDRAICCKVLFTFWRDSVSREFPNPDSPTKYFNIAQKTINKFHKV